MLLKTDPGKLLLKSNFRYFSVEWVELRAERYPFPAISGLQALKVFFNNLFTKSTGKIHCRYEAPREEPREAHSYLALGYDGYMVALSVNVTLWESVKES
jgi:hypothetical protein